MDSSFNEFNDLTIRPPDKVKTERIIEDNRSEYEKQLDEALHLSIQDLSNQEEIYKKYEDDILRDHHDTTKKRREIFSEFLFDIHKLVRFDQEIKEIYEIIEPIIDAYCEQYIRQYEMDSLMYDRIFTIISHIRTNKKNIELLKTIFIRI